MGRKIKLWTLNQATTLLSPHKIDALCAELKRQYNLEECVPGDRRMYNEGVDVSRLKNPPYALMLEDGLFYNEYFVPIDVKCLGTLVDSGFAVLAETLSYHKHIGRKPVLDFWKKDSSNRMFTRNGLGYLSILREEYENGYEAVLVGYSQGGTVARYLAVLDELLYTKRPAVAGLVSLAAPLRGSPLARPANRQVVVDGILAALMSLTPLGFFHGIIRKAEDAVDFRDVKHLIWKLIKMSAYWKNRNLTQTLLNYSKWLGGLEADVNNAFYDLNPQSACEKGAVLNIIRKPLQTPSFGVVTAGGLFGNLFNELLYAHFRFLHFLWDFLIRRKTFGQADQHYRKVFEEQGDLSDYLSCCTHSYRTGRAKPLKIPSFAHDFIIPSEYQILQDSASHSVVNRKAAHFTGFLEGSRGGILMRKQILKGIRLRVKMSRKELKLQLKQLRRWVHNLPQVGTAAIRQTAKRLKQMGFELLWVEESADFVEYRPQDILKALSALQFSEESPDIVFDRALRKVRAFEFLTQLRTGDSSTWQKVEQTFHEA